MKKKAAASSSQGPIVRPTKSARKKAVHAEHTEHDHLPPTAPHHDLTITRTVKHLGRNISVTTTHSIEIDGVKVESHANIGEDGRIHSHATPYCDYADVLELAKALAAAYRQ